MNLTQSIRAEEVKRAWVVLDAKDQVFGRLITQAATLLRGKHRPYYTPHVDCGDFVVVINAGKVKFSGMKLEDKEYFTHSGYFGSTKSKTLKEMLEKTPEKLFFLAVRGMLPKTKLGRAMIKKLKVYKDDKHPHTAQVSKKDN
ncbi:50S ribosomal protein L13 [Helicobacter bizzozeronii]|uniref:Large ribosomal subunit protein uL13 n=1 Tax=Helicobacter bizzozeronii (strain CIII-1) TaxID=1002804 RepID=F8KQU1_HELBC|nr:50S ribosomal protein L13 [Helicobacter bizzozeronii]CCB79095.1 LSU ribosomal protein L13p (L13Ae) [Helicobacter bizzozeronii CIII-1]CCF80588.1 LSU ribosomal protein L13p (L13Ae) [Helicobacter bizzozeronii CCUG 35545]